MRKTFLLGWTPPDSLDQWTTLARSRSPTKSLNSVQWVNEELLWVSFMNVNRFVQWATDRTLNARHPPDEANALVAARAVKQANLFRGWSCATHDGVCDILTSVNSPPFCLAYVSASCASDKVTSRVASSLWRMTKYANTYSQTCVWPSGSIISSLCFTWAQNLSVNPWWLKSFCFLSIINKQTLRCFFSSLCLCVWRSTDDKLV